MIYSYRQSSLNPALSQQHSCRQESNAGKLISSRAYTYKGPSVICEDVGQIKINTEFIILGSTQSTFKKPWYQIEILKTGQKAWIPTKYVKRLGRYNPEPDYTTSHLIDVFVIPTTELNVRKCPSARCERVGSVEVGQRLSATKKSSTNWYFIEDSKTDVSGWISGKYVKLYEEPVQIKKPVVIQTPIVEIHDPCKIKNRITPYKDFAVWRATVDFTVLDVADNACVKRFNITKDQAIISLGEDKTFYQLGVVIDDTVKTGYFPQQDYSNQYVFMHELPANFKRSETKKYILEAQAYWQSFRFKFDQAWLKTKLLYAQNPFKMWTATLALLLLVLHLIPQTRWITVGLYNAIIHVLVKRELQEISSHWSQMVEGLKLTPTEFYSEIEQTLKQKQLPDSRQLSISWPQGGIFSPKRLYYRVARKKSCL